MILTTSEIANELCKCGHSRRLHSHGKSCTATGPTLKFCNCELFRPEANLLLTNQSAMVDSIKEDTSMAKKAKRSKKNGKPKTARKNGATPKGEGRKPVLVGLIDNPLPLYASYKGKDYTATALTSGMIKYDETEYATPSAAAKAIIGNNSEGKPLQVDGWHFWKFNKDGERTALSELRDQKDIRRRPDLQKVAAD